MRGLSDIERTCIAVMGAPCDDRCGTPARVWPPEQETAVDVLSKRGVVMARPCVRMHDKHAILSPLGKTAVEADLAARTKTLEMT